MLKTLQLTGFKSFADRTEFQFARGITGIVGPNGSGKCVVGSTMVTLTDGRDLPIVDLVAGALEKAKVVETLDDGLVARDNPEGIEVLSLNPETLRLESRPVAAFVKRQAPPRLLRVRTRAGREITATPYHPFFTLEKGSLRAIEAGEVKSGLRIALPRRLPVRGGQVVLPPLAVLEQFREEDRVYVPYARDLRTWADRSRPTFGTWAAWANAAAVPQTHLRGFLEGQSIRASSLVKLARASRLAPPLDGRLKCANTSRQLLLPSSLTAGLARFLGMIVAEGRSSDTSNQVWFVNADAAINEDYAGLAAGLFGLEVQRKQYKPAAEDGLIYSAALALVLERLFHFRIGSRSAEKELPPQLLRADAPTQWAFLSGLFEGDAHVCARPRTDIRSGLFYVEYVTASPRLAGQVVALLLRLGVFALLRRKEQVATNSAHPCRRTYYAVLIYGTEQLRHVATHLAFVGAKQARLVALRELAPAGNPNLDLIPDVTPLVKDAAGRAGLSIKAHRARCPRLAAYAEGRCQASRQGILEVVELVREQSRAPEAASDTLARLAALATSDIYWDEVVSVEEVEPTDPWVYDLCVADTHNFVAGNVIVHNSNIVDGIKWVLGEQSAKSLRGGEMADVIFNGSASRRSLGLAEVTMVFDNARHVLATEAEEVQITRRVYRSGEGEYLINGQPCRLKDVKGLFLGSGAGTDAYSIIEQGRVDVLLQASTRERRTIFEEAAGISRFKAKKVETLRRLERVDQNVQRLKDIIDEVEKQLRGVKLQAAKAQRYQEHSARLKELRVGLGLQEYGEVARQLAAETAVLDGLRAALQEQSAQAETWDQEMARLDAALRASEDATREQDSLLAHARQQIAAEETTLGHEATLSADLELERTRTGVRLAELDALVAALAETEGRVGEELRAAEAQGEEQRSGVRAVEDELQVVMLRLVVLQKQVEAERKQHFELVRQSGHLQNDASSFKAEMDNLVRERERQLRHSDQAAENLASVDLALQELTQAEEALQARLAAGRQTMANQRQERERLRQLGDETAAAAAELRERRSGLASRVEVLEGLERSQEGLGTGVREVLELVRAAEPGSWRTVLGMVADLLTVRREYAPLIDLALGERAQRFVVRDAPQLHEALAARGQPFSGRVSFLTLSQSAAEHAPAHANRLMAVSRLGQVRMPASPEGLPAHPGVVALAESLVTCDNADLAHLPAQLLGRTLIVRDLESARTIAALTTGYRFVTLRGELLEPDGTLTVGTHHAETGILSRKSELRELRGDMTALDGRIAETERDLAELRERTAAFDWQAEESQREIDALGEQAADLHARLGQHRERRATLHEEVAGSQTEITRLESDIEGLHGRWEEASAAAARAEAQVQELHARLQAGDREVREREARRERLQEDRTTARAALAQVDERLKGLRARHEQTATDLGQRRQEREQAAQHVAGTRARLLESQRTMLNASSALARWYLEKEAAERRLAEVSAERDGRRAERERSLEQSQAARSAWQQQQEQAHQRELQVNDLRHRRDTLVERLREDYQVDLAVLSTESSVPSTEAPPIDPAQANEEIAELRRKLTRLGAVNLEALQELTDLEARAAALQAQYDDLAAAKRSLEEIIAKINDDSRKLFTDTFAAIRTNFQELFRKLFGGGMADVVLEDEADILESGIEIIARPPGKELRSISLMSGGEKTMTAVALLLAIFRSKPSPFCILDEVDAALDEANIGRFTSVLHDFLDRSHFIIVTHSKRTMSVADVLYGITMQESGISKRVAVDFKDFPDEGGAANGQAAAEEEKPLGSFGGR